MIQTPGTDLRREAQIETRAERPRVGPCLTCGTFTSGLMPGRHAGFNVYCAVCAIGTRTPSRVEKE